MNFRMTLPVLIIIIFLLKKFDFQQKLCYNYYRKDKERGMKMDGFDYGQVEDMIFWEDSYEFEKAMTGEETE